MHITRVLITDYYGSTSTNYCLHLFTEKSLYMYHVIMYNSVYTY